MRTAERWCALALLLAVPAVAAAAEPQPAVPDVVVRRLTAAIDRHVAADWKARNVVPAAEADDAEYCRRVYLDLIGRIPRVAEVHEFLDDSSADKRARLVERLLHSPSYASHFAAAVRADWLPQTLTDQRSQFSGFQVEEWLRQQFAANAPADEIVRKLLTARVSVGQRGQVAFDPDSRETEPAALQGFYQANDVKPEQLAATVSRAFLGVKLECAQCHDHPFAPYTQEQFWEFAAFFGEFTPLPPISPSFVGPFPPQTDLNRLTLPKGNRSSGTRVITARYFDGTDPDWSPDRTPREELTRWLTARDNPYFARNQSNRVWAHFFGIGIIDPVDEPGETNPPSHPALLDELAAGFAEAGFDVRVLIQAITASRPYNLTGKQTDPSQADPRRFARMHLRGLTGNQIYDSFLAATGSPNRGARNQMFADRQDGSGRPGFRTLYGATVPKPTETQTSILQALMLMNGQDVANQTSVDKSTALAAVVDAPFLDSGKKVDAVFLSALTRKPTSIERERFSSYVDRGGSSNGDKDKALADVFWALLNSTEFLFNH